VKLRRQIVCAILLVVALYAQRPFRQYPGREYEDFPLPPDWQEKTEWAFARLMYPPTTRLYGRGFRGGYGNWTQGYSS